MGCLLDQWVSSEARASTFIGFCGFYQDVIVGLLLANSPTLSGPATICQCGVETRGNGRFSKVASQPACKPANATRIDVATLTRAWIFRRLATAATRKLTQCYVSYLFAHLPDLNQRGVVVRRGLESQTGDGSRGQRTDACVFDFV